MRRNRNKFIVICLTIIILVGLLSPWRYLIEGSTLSFYSDLKVKNDSIIQLFYTTNSDEEFSEINSIKVSVTGKEQFQIVKFTFPNSLKNVNKIRLDLGDSQGRVWIKELKLKSISKEYSWNTDKIFEVFHPSKVTKNAGIEDNSACYDIIGIDPYIVSDDISKIYGEVATNKNLHIVVYLSLIIMVLCTVYVILVLYKKVFAFLRGIVESRRLIFDLARNDFKVKYAGSYFGIIWSFIQPVITILIYWFVFQVGFRSGTRPDGTPFILWMICGMVPWFYFSEALQNATNSLLEYSYLVKKVVFRVNILPVVKIVSSFFIHIIFVMFLTIITVISGRYPSVYTLQMFYYLLCTFVLLIGLSWVTSALVVFLKDVSQIVSVILQIGFWATPIVWSTDIIPDKSIEYFFKLNPMFYIVQGYRDSFIENIWFWNRYNQTIYFWLITGVIFFGGAVLFKRLRPHFSDVL